SRGEIAAATAIGALGLEDAALLVARKEHASIRPRSVPTAFISSVTGEPIDTAELDGDYWSRTLSRPVRFAEAVRRAVDLGAGLFIESSPHPVLVGSIEETAQEAEADGVAVVGTLRRGQ